MTPSWRLWVIFHVLVAAAITVLGMQPQWTGVWWPVAGLWLAVTWASFGLSVWAATWLLVLGVMMDLMTEAPLGAWPLALVSAYGVALVVWDRQPPISVLAAEMVSGVAGLVAAALALGAASGIAGQAGFSRSALMGDFLMTALLYPLVRFILIPKSIRAARR
jgi:hypothetical protein